MSESTDRPRGWDIGIVLPTLPAGANAEAIAAAARAAVDLGWTSAWVTDHLLVDPSASASYGTIFEALISLAWIGPQSGQLRLGTSVLIVPQRDAVVLAKELATLDALTGGRLTVGVGVGWSTAEFSNLGMAERFHVRGAYLDEAISLWRHLWSGSTAPFEGRFHRFADFVFGPLPPQGSAIPIVVGGSSDGAVSRAARLGDWYQVSQLDPPGLAARLPKLRAAAEAAGRPVPRLGTRLVVHFDDRPDEKNVLAGDAARMRRRLEAWAAVGVEQLVLKFDETDASGIAGSMERLDREVLRPLIGQ
jgi:probable F420-dependent oxidoreductase